jgi:hypothetical protein
MLATGSRLAAGQIKKTGSRKIMTTQYPSTKAIKTTLRELGFRAKTASPNGITQWSDFRVLPLLNNAGERISNHLITQRRAEQRMWELRDEIEARTAELGSPWYVRKVEFGGYVSLRVSTVKSGQVADLDAPFGKIGA